jgi:hypothetical protein
MQRRVCVSLIRVLVRHAIQATLKTKAPNRNYGTKKGLKFAGVEYALVEQAGSLEQARVMSEDGDGLIAGRHLTAGKSREKQVQNC